MDVQGVKFLAAVAPPLFAVIVLLQWAAGAYGAEFGGNPDEPAHYLTALMIRDYIASGLPAPPMQYAENYYDHYPKIALGNWPPLFYMIQSAWTLVFSPARPSVLLLMAVLTCVLALIVARALAREFAPRFAVIGAVLCVAFPLVQQHAGMVMTEVPVALWSLLATLSFARYVERERARDSVLFGLFASAAIMTKGSGFALALVPPVAILLTGRFAIVKRPGFWYPLVIVAVLAGPWTWFFREVTRAGWDQPFSLAYASRAIFRFPFILVMRTGSLVITAFALIGVATMVADLRRRAVSPLWASLTGLIAGVVIVHGLIPASLDERHIVQALPAWGMLAVRGLVFAERWIAALDARWRWVPAAVAVAGVLHTASYLPIKAGRGFGPVAEDLLRANGSEKPIILISSDATGEGMFIAEAAMREDRPGHIIRRSSKVLAVQQWHGGNYSLAAETPEALIALLTRERIRYVVVDAAVPPMLLAPHHELLQRTVMTSRAFVLNRTYQVRRGYPYRTYTVSSPDGIRVYELQSSAPAATGVK